jgi:hypothetical protein
LSYYDQLQDKRWIRKRDKILKRDKHTCTCCGDKRNLQVHHTYYLSSSPPPWQYPDESLLTVCERCHKKYHYEHEHVILKTHLSYKSKHKKKRQSLKVTLKKDIPPNETLAEKARRRNTEKSNNSLMKVNGIWILKKLPLSEK